MKRLIDYYADWCPPCQQMEPLIREIEANYTVERINIDEEPKKAETAGVMGIPTFVIMEDGHEAKRFVGVTKREELEEALRE